MRPQQILLAAAGLAALGGAAWYGHDWWIRGRFIEATDDAYVGGEVTAIAPHVAGFVQDVSVSDNQRVAAGQLLVRLDRRDFAAALDRARAAREGRQAMASGTEAEMTLQAAMIRQAEAALRSAVARDAFARQEADTLRDARTHPRRLAAAGAAHGKRARRCRRGSGGGRRQA